MAEIRDPDNLSQSERRNLRLEAETKRFSDDHYLADMMENEDIVDILKFKVNTKEMTNLSALDQEQMKNLQNREFLLDKIWQKKLKLGLFDIIFSYCYDFRTTKGHHSVETPWNISRLSATLSWFDVSTQVTSDYVLNPLVMC